MIGMAQHTGLFLHSLHSDLDRIEEIAERDPDIIRDDAGYMKEIAEAKARIETLLRRLTFREIA